jgi:Fe-S-cluster containining protein
MTKKTSLRKKARRRTAAERKAVPTTLNECRDCPALCCHDLVEPIDKPKTAEEVSELKWELQYDTIRVFIRSHRWYRIIAGRCTYLDRGNRCTIYERRPKRCREMKPPACERFGEFYEAMITTPEELDEHLAKSRRR